MPEYIRECEQCGKPFVAKHRNTMFCSNACRQKNYRKMHSPKLRIVHEELGRTLPHPTTKDEIADAIVQTRSATATFSAGRLTADPPLRPLCRTLEVGILKTLEEAGV